MPRVGATDGISMTWPAIPIRLRPVATAMIATAIGIAIAATVPSEISRITIAAAMPILSLFEVLGLETSWPR